MKYILLFAIFLTLNQSDKIVTGNFQYEQIETRNLGLKSHINSYTLNISPTFSTYLQEYRSELDEKYTDNKDDGISNVVVIKPQKKQMKIVYNDFKNNQIFFKDNLAEENVYTKEEKYNMKWELVNETKNYGKRTCYKATTTFRGRNYTAWYLPEIKTNIGPWKFVNTPGLIFEIYDNDKILHIKLNTINTKKYSNINVWENEPIKQILSLKEYINFKEKAQDIVIARLNAQLPKGSKPFIKNKEQKEFEIF